MKTIIIRVSLLLALAFSAGSCAKWLDINTDPNVATEVDPGFLFNYAAVSWSSNRCGGDVHLNISYASQCVADGKNIGGWCDEGPRYDFDPFSSLNAWLYGYICCENLAKAIGFAEEKGAYNAIAQCNILMALITYDMTILYGDMPYSQANNAALYPKPKYDSQKDIFEGLLAQLDNAINTINVSGDNLTKIGNYDIYYKGNMAKWLKAAKSLKLRILLTMVDKDPTKAAAIGTLVTAGGFMENATDNFRFPYFNTPGNYNPCYVMSSETGWDAMGFYAPYMPHNSVVNPMVAVDDPRLPQLFEEGMDGTYAGYDTNEDAWTVDDGDWFEKSCIKLEVFPADMPDILLPYSEVEFMLAEVYARGLGVTQNLATAQTHYQNGIISDCVKTGVPAADAATFAATMTLAAGTAVESIATQMWISNMTRPLEAWTHQRRTRVPDLPVPPEAMTTGLFSKFPYPTSETETNAANMPSPLPDVDTKMWFQL